MIKIPSKIIVLSPANNTGLDLQVLGPFYEVLQLFAKI